MSHDFSGTDDTLSVSYISPTTTSGGTSTSTSYQSLGAYQLGVAGSPLQQLTTAAFGGMFPSQRILDAASIPSPKKEKVMARLIRYTVVNPDPQLAKVKPEISILMSGTVMLDGIDDRGFIMDLAPRVAEILPKHNEELLKLSWENEKGESKPFKAVRLSHLDVVVEALKTYA